MRAILNRRLDNRGVSLAEMMIAMAVLLLVALAMMQTALVSIDANMRNVLRDEGVSIAETALDNARGTKFDDLEGLDGTSSVITRQVRRASVDYTVDITVASPGSKHRNVTVDVQWPWKGETFHATLSTIIDDRREE